MLIPLLKHEILNLLKSKRIYWTVVMFLLLFAAVFVVRAMDYQKQLNQYIADVRLNEDALNSVTNYSFIKPRAIQQPIIFSIYNQGFSFSRVATIQFYAPILGTTALNEENNVVQRESRQLDITFLITFFLSLFILLISYDSVSGEKRVGTLRVLMTYPLKRQSFILKKMLGIFIFVAFTFTLPYFLSLISLMVIYANLLTINFFLSAFFYWFLVMLFIFFFSLLGIFISTCTTSSNRSLVYCLLVWMLLSTILPISWEYIFSPRLYNTRIDQLDQIYTDKWNQLWRIMYSDVPEEADMYNSGSLYSGGDFYENEVWTWRSSSEMRVRYLSYMYETYFPASRETEQARDDLFRKRISIENTKNWLFFFNPIVLFHNLSMKIAGNSREDHLRLLHSTRELRDELIQLGMNEGWLMDRRFFSMFTEEYDLDDVDALLVEFDYDSDRLYDYLMEIFVSAEKMEIELPNFRRYEQPQYSFGEIFTHIFSYLMLFVGSILVLWVMTWQKFLKYDVR